MPPHRRPLGRGVCFVTSHAPDDRQSFFSAKLAGVPGPECNIPKCRAPGRTLGTGWIRIATLGWAMEFACPDHGALLATGSIWTPMIGDALAERSAQS